MFVVVVVVIVVVVVLAVVLLFVIVLLFGCFLLSFFFFTLYMRLKKPVLCDYILIFLEGHLRVNFFIRQYKTNSLVKLSY